MSRDLSAKFVNLANTRFLKDAVGRDTLEAWEKEFGELVKETVSLWSGPLGWDRKPKDGRRGLCINETDECQKHLFTELISEVSDYPRACLNSGVNPAELDVFESRRR